MQNRSKNRTDIQWILASISAAATIGFWGMFASHDKGTAGVKGEAMIASPTDQVLISQTPSLLPGQKLLFGGTSPQQQQTVVVRKKHGGGGGGGGGAASTGSSKP